MRIILTIANREFSSFFYSIKGWAVFWFALFFMGMFFWSFISTYVELQHQGSMNPGGAPHLNQLLTAIFHNLHFILILIVPALTMASFAEERRTQTLRLLQSSPINNLQIVLGKFLGCSLILVLVLVSTAVFPLFTVVYGNPDVGLIISSYIGLLLLMSGHVAFGIWVSSLTNNQFMAFLFTMGGVFLLMILNWIAPNLTSDNVVANSIKFIATSTHLENLFKGLITISDLTYFAAFILLFIYFCYLSVDSLRWR